MTDETDNEARRRTVLKTLGVTAAAAGIGGVAAGQDDNETDEETPAEEADDEDDPLPIILGGEATHWYGLTPHAIHGEENPTLELAAGEEYELVWINLDGEEHDLIVEDPDGEELEESEESETAGEVVSMTFEATEEMTEYYCEYHPEDMRAEIELDGGFDLSEYGGEDEMDDGNETEDDGMEHDNETIDDDSD